MATLAKKDKTATFNSLLLKTAILAKRLENSTANENNKIYAARAETAAPYREYRGIKIKFKKILAEADATYIQRYFFCWFEAISIKL